MLAQTCMSSHSYPCEYAESRSKHSFIFNSEMAKDSALSWLLAAPERTPSPQVAPE